MEKKFFILYSHNVLVKGMDKAAIYDLQHGKIHAIPFVLCQVIDDLKKLPLKSISDKYTPANPEILNKYIAFFSEKSLGFYTDQPEAFPDIDFSWYSPSMIQNALIEYEFDNYDLKNVFEQLDELNCKQIELRTQSIIPDNFIKTLSSLEDKTFSSVSVLIAYHSGVTDALLEKLLNTSSKITALIIYNAPSQHKLSKKPNDRLFILKEDLRATRFIKSYSHNKCFVNISFFSEAQQHNCYYNRKVCIDSSGNIKNCLRHEKAFGNVNLACISDIISSKDFQDLWYANVDKIADLNSSVYRYCTFVSNPLLKLEDQSYKIIAE